MIRLSAVFTEWFERIKADNTVASSIKEIIEVIFSEENLPVKMEEIRSTYDLADLKLHSLDFLILYANELLSDHYISEDELNDFSFLKTVLKIGEGDFIRYRSFEVQEILKQQFIRMYADNFIDEKEAIESVNLQALFDLGYDEFEKIKEDEIISALLNGAKPEDLDISSLPKSFEI